ncbi:uncharacterized protein P174DRAFT_186619 [Aspergillus novofumigatus IBT 16806]|uniref:Uncharacterized protein n=1 Tax=Aspergillus novofumigatus (strain IBT 16806) TaxID=1392255 RepID=A0A2I1CAA5_ASPN1|nr:uncharacterized protein P174DRAFT_186619 [Aspergillus novofumigatus IBT 16806]PKX94555.1 hypothetical protein P174DRAFT_186619 [Aspergillus novofumigatus IBT 16806]
MSSRDRQQWRWNCTVMAYENASPIHHKTKRHLKTEMGDAENERGSKRLWLQRRITVMSVMCRVVTQLRLGDITKPNGTRRRSKWAMTTTIVHLVPSLFVISQTSNSTKSQKRIFKERHANFDPKISPLTLMLSAVSALLWARQVDSLFCCSDCSTIVPTK